MNEHELESIKAIAIHGAMIALEPEIAKLHNPHGCNRFSPDPDPHPGCVLRDDVLRLIRGRAAKCIEGET